jgi:hypothetical protein
MGFFLTGGADDSFVAACDSFERVIDLSKYGEYKLPIKHSATLSLSVP